MKWSTVTTTPSAKANNHVPGCVSERPASEADQNKVLQQNEKNRLTISASVSTRSVGRRRHQAGNIAGSPVIYLI